LRIELAGVPVPAAKSVSRSFNSCQLWSNCRLQVRTGAVKDSLSFSTLPHHQQGLGGRKLRTIPMATSIMADRALRDLRDVIVRMLQRNLIVILHNLIVLAAIWPFVRWSLYPSAVLSLAGLVLLYLFLVGTSAIIAIICVRYRDVPQLVQVLIQFLFFLTPII